MLPYPSSLFYFAFQNNSPCFYLKDFSKFPKDLKIFSRFLAQCPKSLYCKCSHLSCITLLGSGMGFGQPTPLILSSQNLRFFLFFSLLNLLLMFFIRLFNKPSTSGLTHQRLSSLFWTCITGHIYHMEPAGKKKQPGSSPELSTVVKLTFRKCIYLRCLALEAQLTWVNPQVQGSTVLTVPILALVGINAFS